MVRLEVSYDEFGAYWMAEKPLIAPVRQHAFPYRSCKLADRFFNLYYSKIRKENLTSSEAKRRIGFHEYRMKQQAQIAVSGVDRYYNIFPGVRVDRLDLLEVLGATASYRRYQGVFTLAPYLPEMLAFLIHASNQQDVERIRENLKRRCERYNISYYELCHAVVQCDNAFIYQVPLDVFIGLHEDIDLVIHSIYYTEDLELIANGEVLNLSGLSPEDRVLNFLLYQIAVLNQLVFNKIIGYHMDDSESSPAPYLTSKGVGQLTFQMYAPTGLESYELDLNGVVVDLSPKVFERRRYTIQYAKGEA